MDDYRAVCFHRTGSTFLTEYVNKFYGTKAHTPFEFLLDSYILHTDGTITRGGPAEQHGCSLDRVLKKLDYLEQTKLRNENFPIKIIPSSTAELGIEKRLTNYLKGYKIITIARNPWDSFMSFTHQTKTKWRRAHNWVGSPEFQFENIRYEIDESDVMYYAFQWWYNIKFLCELELHHVFNYEDLNTETLNKFFGKEVETNMLPLDINYKECIVNYDEAYTMFNKHFSGWETALYMMRN